MPVQWKTSFPVVSQVRRFASELAEIIQSRIGEAAMAAGVTVLEHAQRDYEKKSRHGTGEDGVTWKDLSPKTIEARVRRRGPAKSIVEERRQLAQEIRGILHGQISPVRKVTRGKQKGKVVQIDREKAVSDKRRRRETLGKQLGNLIAKEMSSYQIGVDQGLQRASAAPGFNDPAKVWRLNPTDNKGQNLFEIDGGSVTLGYNRSYSAAFDSDRPLFPEQLPKAWRDDAEEAVDEWLGDVVRDVISGIN